MHASVYVITAVVTTILLYFIIEKYFSQKNIDLNNDNNDNMNGIKCNDIVTMTHKYNANFYYDNTEKLDLLEAINCCQGLDKYLAIEGNMDVNEFKETTHLWINHIKSCSVAIFRVESKEELPPPFA